MLVAAVRVDPAAISGSDASQRTTIAVLDMCPSSFRRIRSFL